MKLAALFLAAVAIAPTMARVAHSYDRSPNFQVERASHDIFDDIPDYTQQRSHKAPSVWTQREDDVAEFGSPAEDIVNVFADIVRTVYSIKLKLIDVTAWTALIVIPQITYTITGTVVVAFTSLARLVLSITRAFTVAESDLIINAFAQVVGVFTDVFNIFVDKRGLFNSVLLFPLVKTIYLALTALHAAVYVVLNALVKLIAVGAAQARFVGLINELSASFSVVIRVYA